MLSEGTRLESALRATDDLKLVGYIMAGHPNKKRSIEIGKRLASSGIAAAPTPQDKNNDGNDNHYAARIEV